MCCIITFIVRKGMSPHGTLLAARDRQSFGGTDCRECSIAGKTSTASRQPLSRSLGILRASFQMHLRTSSATLASCDSGCILFPGKGLTIFKSSANKALEQIRLLSIARCIDGIAHRNTDIRLAEPNTFKIIRLMNLEISLTFVSELSSVWSSCNVSSSRRVIIVAIVSDSANKLWEKNEWSVCIKCLASLKFAGSSRSFTLSKTWEIWTVMVSMSPSECSAISRKACESDIADPFAGSRTFWIFFNASTLLVGSLLRIFEIIMPASLLSYDSLSLELAIAEDGPGSECSSVLPISRGVLRRRGTRRSRESVSSDSSLLKFCREEGRASREGKKVFLTPIMWGLTVLVGALVTWGCGEAVLEFCLLGEAERGLDKAGFGRAVDIESFCSSIFAPGTRRSLSSSCVLSFSGNFPIIPQILSPKSGYALL